MPDVFRLRLKMRKPTCEEPVTVEYKFTQKIVTPAVSYREIFSISIISIQHFSSKTSVSPVTFGTLCFTFSGLYRMAIKMILPK